MRYRIADIDDLHRIVKLYKAVARIEGGIARQENEITENYVRHFIAESVASGLIIVAEHPENPDELIAEMHGYKSGPFVFDHVLGDLAFPDPVDPDPKLAQQRQVPGRDVEHDRLKGEHALLFPISRQQPDSEALRMQRRTRADRSPVQQNPA